MSLPRYHCATPLYFSLFISPYFISLPLFAKKKTPSPGIEPGAQTWEACMLPTTPQWIADSLTLSPTPHDPPLYFFIFSPNYIILFTWCYDTHFLLWEVSWCSWLSHHFHVVRVPGSNPGGTIFVLFIWLPFYLYISASIFFHTYLFYSLI